MNNDSWKAIFDKYKINKHNFSKEPFLISAEQIKQEYKLSYFLKQKKCEMLSKSFSKTQWMN